MVKTADVVMMMMMMTTTAMVMMGVVAVFLYSFALKHGSPREKKVTTLNMKIFPGISFLFSFTRPVKVGQLVHVHTTMKRQRKQFHYLNVKILSVVKLTKI